MKQFNIKGGASLIAKTTGHGSNVLLQLDDDLVEGLHGVNIAGSRMRIRGRSSVLSGLIIRGRYRVEVTIRIRPGK